MAIAGILLEVFFMDRFRALTVGTYVGMGWLAVIAVKPLLQALPLPALLWILVGGLSYTGGVTFYLWRKLPYNHAVWHLFVLGGSVCHFLAIFRYVLFH